MGYWNPSSWKKITHLSFIVNTIVADILVKYSGFSTQWVNSSPPSATYMCQSIRRELVQIMACCLFSTKPLCKPVLGNCQLVPLVTNFSEIIIKISHFSFIKKHLIILSVKWQICRPGGDESKQMIQVPLFRNLLGGGGCHGNITRGWNIEYASVASAQMGPICTRQWHQTYLGYNVWDCWTGLRCCIRT